MPVVYAFGTMPPMVEPRIIPRAEHPISRRDIDPDALKVLYRLRQYDHVAYLVGGSVRDLLLGRRPKDFDIGTSAHPYQVKKLFRNCWIIGRRFRLAHVKFGTKVIEVATFRRQVAAGRRDRAGRRPGARSDHARRRASDPSRQHLRHAGRGRVPPRLHDQRAVLRHRDVLDHRLRRRARGSARRHRAVDRRSGGAVPRRPGADAPRRRARGAARLHDRPPCSTRSARIATRSRRARAPRLLEEYYKILRAGSAEKTFRGAGRGRVCSSRSPPSCIAAPTSRSGDRSRRSTPTAARFESTPDTLTNAILLGSLLVPLGIPLGADAVKDRAAADGDAPDPAASRRGATRRCRGSASCRSRGATSSVCGRSCRLQRRLRDRQRQPAGAARAGAPQHLPRGADLARDSRRCAGAGRALEGARGAETAGRSRGGRAAPCRVERRRRRRRRADAERRAAGGVAAGAGVNRTPASYAATSSIVLYGFASRSEINSLMTGHAGSISLARKLNFGLRG